MKLIGAGGDERSSKDATVFHPPLSLIQAACRDKQELGQGMPTVGPVSVK